MIFTVKFNYSTLFSILFCCMWM